VPGTDRGPDSDTGTNANPVLAGTLIRSEGQAAVLPGAWPGFRGPNRDAISPEPTHLLRAWPPSAPREVWGIDVGEGYAGAAVLNGRVYLMDYDRDKKQDALRCLSLADGREIWRYAYAVSVKRNHGMSRTVPAVTGKFVVAMGPKCHVVCLDPVSGQLLWGLDLVRQYGATVRPWYAGQCPLIDQGAVVLAPGGKDALLLAVDGQTGKVHWKRWVVRPLLKLEPEVFGATQHTPVLYDQHLYGVRADGKFVCLTLEGKPVWTSDSGQAFGLGSFILADGVLLAMNDSGLLRLLEATPDKYHLLAQAQVLKGRESWAPLAIAGGRLLARDLTRLVCLEVGER